MGLFDFLKPKKNLKPQPVDDEGNSVDFDLADDTAGDGCDCGDSDCGCDGGSSD